MPGSKVRKYVAAAKELVERPYLVAKDFCTTLMFKWEKKSGYGGLFSLNGESAPESFPVPRDPEIYDEDGTRVPALSGNRGTAKYEYDPINFTGAARAIQYFKTGKVGAMMLAIAHSMMAWMKMAFSLSSSWVTGRCGDFVYAGGMDAVKTASVMAAWAVGAVWLCEGDFSKYDSYQVGPILSSEMFGRKMIHEGLWRHPLTRRVLEEMAKSFRSICPGLGVVEGTARRLSGDPFTSYANSMNNFFLGYFAMTIVYCRELGIPDSSAPSLGKQAALHYDFGIIFNGDDHVLKANDRTLFAKMQGVLEEMGMVVKYKKPVPGNQLSKVGFLGGFPVQADMHVGQRVVPTWVIIPDLERFATSLPWKLSNLPEREWRRSVAAGWRKLLGSMPIYRQLLLNLCPDLDSLTEEDVIREKDWFVKTHKKTAYTITPNVNTFFCLADRYSTGNVGEFEADVASFEWKMAKVPPWGRAILRCPEVDKWVGNSRG